MLYLKIIFNVYPTSLEFEVLGRITDLIKIISLLGQGSSVGIATGYGLNGPGIESQWGRGFPHLSRPALGRTQPPVKWLPGLSRGVKSGRGVTLTPHLLLVPWSRKSRAIPLLPAWAVRPVQSLSACTVDQYLYSPYRPYSLHRASVPVQYSYTSSPPIGCTACTEPQCCTVQLYLYFPYGPYGLYRASVPVQYSYTSTPPIGRTACTEPQCLYSTAISLLPL